MRFRNRSKAPWTAVDPAEFLRLAVPALLEPVPAPPALTLAEVAELAASLPKPRALELHCHPLVWAALVETVGKTPAFEGLPFPSAQYCWTGVPVYEHADMGWGTWELREDGTVVGQGTAIPTAAREATP